MERNCIQDIQSKQVQNQNHIESIGPAILMPRFNSATQSIGLRQENLQEIPNQIAEVFRHNDQPEKSSEKNWTASQIEKLFQIYGTMGPKWKIIALEFQNKSDNVVKNKFHLCLKKFLRKLNNFIKQKIYKHKKLIKYEGIIHILSMTDPLYEMAEMHRLWNEQIRAKIIYVTKIIAQDKIICDDQFEWLMVNINKYNIDTKSYRIRKIKTVQLRQEERSVPLRLNQLNQSTEKKVGSALLSQSQLQALVETSSSIHHISLVDEHYSNPSPLLEEKPLIFIEDPIDQKTNDFNVSFDISRSPIYEKEYERFYQVCSENLSSLCHDDLLI